MHVPVEHLLLPPTSAPKSLVEATEALQEGAGPLPTTSSGCICPWANHCPSSLSPLPQGKELTALFPGPLFQAPVHISPWPGVIWGWGTKTLKRFILDERPHGSTAG